MRFGLFIPQGWRLDLVGIEPAEHWDAMMRVAEHADQGTTFESIWVYDHFHTTPVPTDQATHEAWTLMAALGASTERVRLGQMCTCMAYRNPAYLAKVAATVDIVSGGRTEMGIGAGWYEHEWRAYGYGFPRAGERLAMLDEGVQIMRQLWNSGTATLDGKHYTVDGAICRPLPLQDEGIPLWIAGGGEKVTLRIAAKHARGGDVVDGASYTRYTNFGGSDVEQFTHKSEVLAQHCRELGTDFDSITRSANITTVLGETESDVEDKLTQLAEAHRPFVAEGEIQSTLTNLRNSPTVGTPAQVTEALATMRDAGMTYAVCYFFDAAHDLGSVELFEREVAPALL
ncbi:LLM class F420-dependent oxidoreductase [Phytoactinopolyspora alkaliphila]|uniref:LLM class F420-dependent oxidoreductase n=1 Tax=Phytoactinopolyspora alkaliphila TaxID=1783498 RepID=A0A6N9YHU1_9ACTN|nr:LLM class F420-dependent oxidoreductase [Phytoactinopolyspora alkaliphila]